MTEPRPPMPAERAAGRIPILTYHSLDDSRSPISIAPGQFCRQMEWLHRNHWRTLSLGDLLAGLTRGAWPARTFVLTFDDGFANFAQQALPVLQRLDFAAIVFVVAAWAGRDNGWPGQPAWVPRLPLMDWDCLRAITRSGITLGAHTLNHSHLSRLAASEAEREVAEGRRCIEEQTGGEVQAFAYPYGEAPAALEAAVARHYRAGFGTQLGFTTRASHAMQLERIDMYYLRGVPWDPALDSAWLGAYLAIRRVLRRLRLQPALPERAHSNGGAAAAR